MEGQISDIDMPSFPAPIDTRGSLSSLYSCIFNICNNFKSRHLQVDMVAVMRQERNIPMHGSSRHPCISRLKPTATPLAMGADFRPHSRQFIARPPAAIENWIFQIVNCKFDVWPWAMML